MKKAGGNNYFVQCSNSLFILTLLSFFIIVSVSFAFAQTSQYQSIKGIVFKDGAVLRGQIIEMNTNVVKIQTSDGNVYVHKFDDVQSFIKDDGGAPTTPTSSYDFSMGTRKDNYVVIKAGLYSPQSDDLREFGTGFNGEIALGHYFNQFLATEISSGYFRTTASDSATVSGFGRVTANATISVVPITLSVKPIYAAQDIEMYALGGVGAYIAKGELSGTVGGTAVSVSDTNTVFGIQLGAGVNFNITREVFLGLEGKYFWAKPKWQTNGITINANIDGFLFTGNLGFRF
jgi:opacity protein-like surface antigen